MNGERRKYREARDTLARDLLAESQRSTQGSSKRPLTPEQARARATETVQRVDRKEREAGR